MKRFNTPLRYPGGKGRLADFIRLVFEQNGVSGGHYVEPYCGGAAISFPLLYLQYARHVHLNDFNKSVYLFWKTVLHQTEELCQKISRTRVSMAQWHRQSAVQRQSSQHNDLDVAFSTFFLNRCNRSGIIDGGVIGGRNQTGNWKLDARFNKKDLIARIQKIAQQSSRISLYNLDAEQFLRRLVPTLPDRSLIYLDPPYYEKGWGLYEDHYVRADHVRVARFVQGKLRHKWIVSYDNRPETQALYSSRRRVEYNLSYSAGDKYFGSEVMFFSDNLVIPHVANPARLSPHPRTAVIPARYVDNQPPMGAHA